MNGKKKITPFENSGYDYDIRHKNTDPQATCACKYSPPFINDHGQCEHSDPAAKARKIAEMIMRRTTCLTKKHQRDALPFIMEIIAAALDAERKAGGEERSNNPLETYFDRGYLRGLEEAAKIASSSKSSADPIEIAGRICTRMQEGK